ncbi:spectrin beta chain, erythrocytic [Gadus chalcogrammus]|uniref:spectrin beta chain, erythrocytic n=1 Tax=Gadus chalcogrammus TaxID=1042646 RepID=UPI0024C28479|nr:spectrin beta chain, erythrocytic [Gadus chalcogrammus]
MDGSTEAEPSTGGPRWGPAVHHRWGPAVHHRWGGRRGPQILWCYQELCALAAQRRARLEQSRRFWNFLWEAAEVESWVKEKEHIFSTLDYGKDLTSVLILQGKHNAFEDELGARRAHLQQVLALGEDMVRAEHFGAAAVEGRGADVRRQWQELEDLAAFRKQSLQDTQKFFQFQGDADDLTAWLLEAKRQMGSPEVGTDEYTTQRLLRKHRDLRNETAKNGATIDALSRQAQALPEELRNTPDIQRRLKDIRELYVELMALADVRQKALDDTMALYTVLSETDACELWMGQKETWLVGLEVPDKLEDLEIVQNRLSILTNDMANVQSRVDDVNQAVQQLEDSRHPRTKEIKDCQMRLNKRWEAFKAMVEEKKRRVDSALSLHNYGGDCGETEAWIKDKTRVIESTQDLGNDLAAVIAIQRKLFGMERDLAAIDTKLSFLRNEADQLARDHPELADDIRARRGQLDAAWDALKKTLKDREDSLGEVSKLQTFLQDMDDFQSWLFRTQKAVASEDVPGSLPEAEALLSLHDALRDDIANHREDFLQVKETGARVTQGQEDDPQYQQLEQRLSGLDRGWNELQKMWDSRKDFLDQGLGFQQFMRDAKATDTILNNQEYTLAHVEKPDTLAGAEKALKKHEDFLSTMGANEEKVEATVKTGQRLLDAENLYSGKVKDKMASITERHNANQRRATEVSGKLKDNRDLQHFLQNTQDLTLWINEKMLTAQDTSYDEARNLHSKWLKHQAFMAELASNKGWLDNIDQEGQELSEAKPEFEPLVRERLAELHALWSRLESTTQEKARLLFDANRSELLDQSLADVKQWLGGLQQQLHSGGGHEEEVRDLTNANILLKKHQVTENQVRDRARELEELQEAVQKHGGAREDQPELEAEQRALQGAFRELLTPLAQRRDKLEAAKAIHQYYRDLADELLWVEERLPLATSQEHGHNLQTVQMLQKKHQTLQREIEGHQPRVDEVQERGRRMAAASIAAAAIAAATTGAPGGGEGEGTPEARRIAREAGALEQAWGRLGEEMERRKERLGGADEAQQYLNDAEEAEAWVGEQELYMISDETPKDEQSAMLMLKRHLLLKQAVDDYSQPIRRLAARAQRLLAEDHPEGETIVRRQGQVEQQYAGLRELAEERRRKLDHTYQHHLLSREVEELEQWIAERDVAASSQEMGHDLDQVTLLRDRFRDFARDTGVSGQERVDQVNETIDELISAGHSQASTLADWKDAVNESWADLLELIDTRGQLLSASYELLKYFDDGKELVVQIHEKQKELPQDVGEDFGKAETFHRMHAAFERDITSLDKQVHQFQATAGRLQAQYAGEQAGAIAAVEKAVLEAWRGLLAACDGRRAELVDTAEKYHFFTMVKDLLGWMEAVGQQIETQEKPRDVSSVELLQKYHQGIRSEIEARGPKFTDCMDLGRALLTRKHRDSAEIKEKLVLLMETRKEMMLRWDDRWDWLRLLLEVCQFSRDASVAEAWLIAQEPYVASREVGHSVNEVEKLLKRHEAFEKSTASWEERFCALERLTTMELLELRQQQQEMEEFRKEQLESERDSRREDTGFVEDSQLLTTERQTLSPSPSGALAGEADADPSSGVPDSTVLLLSESLRESGSMELDPSISAAGPSAWEPRAATMPSEGPRAPALLQEGTLGRKHDLEGPGKKASNRSWNSLYCVLKLGQLSVYKDSKSFGHAVTFHGEDPLALDGAGWEPLANYKKKKHVFKLRLRDGGEYLFQCKDEEELQRWGAAMSQAALAQEGAEPADSSGAKAHSLPPPPPSATPSEPPKKDKKAEKKFFSKKK